MAETAANGAPAGFEFSARNRRFELGASLGRDWHGGRPFRTAFFNALSFSFPTGEKFFVDSVRHFLPRIENERLKKDAAVFVQQEYIHRREHQRYNEKLAAARGFDGERLESLFVREIERAQKEPPIVQLAATVVLEHITAMFAAGSMRNSRWMDGADPAMAELWNWHAIEETEHKSVAYDVFLAVGGERKLLRNLLRIIRMRFPYHVFLTICRMRRMDGRPVLSLAFWREGYDFLFGSQGVLREIAPEFRLFYRDDFHPWMVDNRDLLEKAISAQT